MALPVNVRLRRDKPGNPYGRGRISTFDLLSKIGCFVKKEKKYFKYEKQLI
jgi:hypothetical protein